MDWYLEVLRKYAVFEGRARRKEYWFFILFNVLISFVLGIIDNMLGLIMEGVGLGVLGLLYGLFVLIPSIAVTIRRLHDSDRTGWWFLIAFVPLIGGLVLLIFMVLDGNRGRNRYGEDPQGRAV